MQAHVIVAQNPELYSYLTKWFIGFICTAIAGALLFPVRYFARAVKAEWTKTSGTMDYLRTQMQVVTTNHLHHIQENTGETVNILRQMQIDNAELIGYLKGRDAGHKK